MVYMDFYETIQYLEINSTPEFFRLLTQTILEERPLENASIVDHLTLLPGEKIALITVNNIRLSHPVISSKATKEQCQAAWDKGMADCRNRLYWKIGATTLFTLVNPILGTITGGATALDHDKCTTTVNREYNLCMGGATTH